MNSFVLMMLVTPTLVIRPLVSFGDLIRISCTIPTEGKCYLMERKGELIWVRADAAPVGNKFVFILKGDSKRTKLGETLRHETPFAIGSSTHSHDHMWFVCSPFLYCF